ncbi:MAG: hypothetical protein ACMG6E_08825, partial [Candidatus Roizmanbacteria bacterium]
KILTLGSPHHGAPPVYKALSAGDIETDSSSLWLSEKVIIELSKGFDPTLTDKQLLNNNLPILKDLLPTTNYLKNQSNITIPENIMSLRNTFLKSYDTIGSLQPNFHAFNNNSFQSIGGYVITPPTLVDQLLGYYGDGHPISSLLVPGDGLLTQTTEIIGTNNTTIAQTGHGAMAYSKAGIENVLQVLGLPYTQNALAEGLPLFTFPSLLMIINSPIHLTASYAGKNYEDTDGILYIPNATTGSVTLHAQGTGQGPYKIHIGRLISDAIYWNFVKGEITNQNPPSQVDTLTIDLTNQPQTPTLFSLSDYLRMIDSSVKSTPTSPTLHDLTIVKMQIGLSLQAISQNNQILLTNQFLAMQSYLINALAKASILQQPPLEEALSTYHSAYAQYKKSSPPPKSQVINNLKAGVASLLQTKATKLLKLKQKDTLKPPTQYLFTLANKYFTEATIPSQISWFAEIKLKSAKAILQVL